MSRSIESLEAGATMREEIATLRAQRDELSETLDIIADHCEITGTECDPGWIAQRARTALSRATSSAVGGV